MNRCYISLDSVCVAVTGNTVAGKFVKLADISFPSNETLIYVIRFSNVALNSNPLTAVIVDNGQAIGTQANYPLSGSCAVGDSFSFPENHGINLKPGEHAGIYLYWTAVVAVNRLATVFYRSVFGSKIKG